MRYLLLAIILIMLFPAVALADDPLPFEPTTPITPSLPGVGVLEYSGTYTGVVAADSYGEEQLLSQINSLNLIVGIVNAALTIWHIIWWSDDYFFMVKIWIVFMVMSAIFWMASWIVYNRNRYTIGAARREIRQAEKYRQSIGDELSSSNPFRERNK